MSTSNGEYDPKVTAKKFAITGGLSSVLMIVAMAFARWKTNPEGFEPTGDELSTIGIVVWGVIGGVLTGAAKAWRNWQKNRKKGQPPAWVSGFAVLLCAAIGAAGCMTTPPEDRPERLRALIATLQEHPEATRTAIDAIQADLADSELELLPTIATLGTLAADLDLDVHVRVPADVALLLDALEAIWTSWPTKGAGASWIAAEDRAALLREVQR